MVSLNRFFSILLVAGMLSVVLTPYALSQPYRNLPLSSDLTIDIPRNWYVIDENQLITLDAYATAIAKQIDDSEAVSSLDFAANYYGPDGNTAGIFNVRFYPLQTITQSDVRMHTDDIATEVEREFRNKLPLAVEQSGQRIVEWVGTSSRWLGGKLIFETEYRRSSHNGVFRVRLIRLLDSARSNTITISYREDQDKFLRPITDYMIESTCYGSCRK